MMKTDEPKKCPVCGNQAGTFVSVGIGAFQTEAICQECFSDRTRKAADKMKKSEKKKTSKREKEEKREIENRLKKQSEFGSVGEYHMSSEVQEFIQKVISKIQELSWISEFEIAGVEKSGSMDKFGSIIVLGDKYRLVSFVDAILVVKQDSWKLSDEQTKMALIAHELCHLSMTEDGKLKTEKHEIEEFNLVIREFGPWTNNLKSTVEQLELFKINQIGVVISNQETINKEPEEETEEEKENQEPDEAESTH